MTQQLPEGWKSGDCLTTGRPCYINIYNDKGQWDFPTKTAYQTQIQDMQNTIEQQQDEIRQVRSRDLEMRTRQQKEIRELRALLEKQQKEIQELQTTQTSPPQASPAPPSSPTNNKSEAKEPRQPSSYKPPQPRTCEKCSTTFPSGHALINIYQIANPLDARNATPRSLRIPHFTNTSADVAVQRKRRI
jgi:hypothetical protein